MQVLRSAATDSNPQTCAACSMQQRVLSHPIHHARRSSAVCSSHAERQCCHMSFIRVHDINATPHYGYGYTSIPVMFYPHTHSSSCACADGLALTRSTRCFSRHVANPQDPRFDLGKPVARLRNDDSNSNWTEHGKWEGWAHYFKVPVWSQSNRACRPTNWQQHQTPPIWMDYAVISGCHHITASSSRRSSHVWRARAHIVQARPSPAALACLDNNPPAHDHPPRSPTPNVSLLQEPSPASFLAPPRLWPRLQSQAWRSCLCDERRASCSLAHSPADSNSLLPTDSR